jgi:hypothetical protein
MTSENTSNSRSSGRGRYRSITPRKRGNESPQPSPGDVPATDLPLSESAVALSSPRKRRVKSPPPETTPTRLRQMGRISGEGEVFPEGENNESKRECRLDYGKLIR